MNYNKKYINFLISLTINKKQQLLQSISQSNNLEQIDYLLVLVLTKNAIIKRSRLIGNTALMYRYPNIDEMWQIQLNNKQSKYKVVQKVGSRQNWYNKANQYWEVSYLLYHFLQNTQSSYNGVLGGYANLSPLDINYSRDFLLKLMTERKTLQHNSVIDCGAGVGRISKQLLCQLFKNVDVLDQCQKYVQKAKEILKEKKNIRNFYVAGMQDFKFIEKYDVIWVQWVLSHLSDTDAVDFFKRAKQHLNEGGIIFLKENHCKTGFLVDKQDFSVTRSNQLYKKLFKQAGLNLVKEQIQTNWPSDLFQVRIYALE